ncbi:MAG: sigma 54-interacting transcriptional regulator [Spirochaetales bacterium]|nr:sigma 54-interacting transcriptional regulator [Spirochaetales bacterium]
MEKEYEDILVTDRNGHVMFCDMSNAALFDLRYEDILNRNVLDLYENLTEEDSTVYQVLRTGKSVVDHEQILLTLKGNRIRQIGSTYPIIDNGTVTGAIEFSKYMYSEDSLKDLESYAGHRGYRQNNTIYCIEDLISGTASMDKLKYQMRKIAETESTVLISGETGSGKEIVAQSLHNLGRRFEGPFVSQNCAAIPESLLESLLFGTVKGSYTGALDKPGLFEAAAGGTLFLDEINSLSAESQIKLLKVIEEKRLRRLGDVKNIDIDVRIIVAMNENPLTSMREGQLRKDLYYRISMVQLNIPPLRERAGDIPLLLSYFVDFYNSNMPRKIKGFSRESLSILKEYRWPGNVRELRNLVEGLFNLAEGRTFTPADLPPLYRSGGTLSDLSDPSLSLNERLEEFEKKILMDTLKVYGGNSSRAAGKLGISKQNMYHKLNKYGLRK